MDTLLPIRYIFMSSIKKILLFCFNFQKITEISKINIFLWKFEISSFYCKEQSPKRKLGKICLNFILGPQNGQHCFWPGAGSKKVIIKMLVHFRVSVLFFWCTLGPCARQHFKVKIWIWSLITVQFGTTLLAADISQPMYTVYQPCDLLVDQLIGELRVYGPPDNAGRASIAIRVVVYSSIG